MAEERRLVTVLFADVVGSTALGESMDPEDVRSLLGRLLEIAREVIEEHGGRLEKFIGDAIMAVFGLPTAHDDDAARALSAALDLRDRVQADPTLAERVPIRLGVNGGEVIATRDADAHQFLITGDPVNTAKPNGWFSQQYPHENSYRVLCVIDDQRIFPNTPISLILIDRITSVNMSRFFNHQFVLSK